MTLASPTFDELVAPLDDLTDLPVAAHWSGFGGAHGGLMVAALGRAMEQAAGRPLRSIHADLLSGVKPGRLTTGVSVDRAGRSVAYASAAGRQDGTLRLRATGVLGGAGSGPLASSLVFADRTLQMPDVPGPQELETWVNIDTPALRTVEFKPATANIPGTGPDPEFHVWVAILGDDAPLDPWRLLTLCDAPAPGLFGLTPEPFPVPTVELTAQLLPAARSAAGRWALARMRTVQAAGGWSIDDCELWDEAGRPLVLSRQTRRVLG